MPDPETAAEWKLLAERLTEEIGELRKRRTSSPSSIPRYDPIVRWRGTADDPIAQVVMQQSPKGEWVKFSDLGDPNAK